MKNCRYILLAIFFVLCASSAIGQDLNLGLQRSGFTRFTIEGRKFSFRDAGCYISDAATIDRINKGLTMEKVAIGLGVSTPVFAVAGLLLFPEGFFNGPQATAWTGLTLMGLGVSMGITAVVLGSCGYVKVKKAVEAYNSASLRSEFKVGVAATPGGLGLQMTF